MVDVGLVSVSLHPLKQRNTVLYNWLSVAKSVAAAAKFVLIHKVKDSDQSSTAK